jgi:hypothetical protein
MLAAKVSTSFFLIILSAFSPAIALAEGPYPVKKGDPSPVDGVIFPTLEAAKLAAELEQSEKMCTAKIEFEVAKAGNESNLLLNNCKDSKAVITDMYTTQIDSNKEYIKFLEDKVTQPTISQELIFIVGTIVGIGVTLGAGYTMNQLSK